MANKSIKDFLTDFMPPVCVIKKQKTEEGIDGRIIPYSDRRSYIAEQYKVLRTNLYSLSSSSPIKTILITSSQPGEGKTITSCNLAATLSLDAEKKTILVDADFRKSSVYKMFNISKTPGFSEILTGKAALSDFIDKPAVRDLYIIPAGKAATNLSENVSSTKIKEVIEELKTKFNYIIIDTPPVLSLADACILGSMCDAILLVVRQGVTTKGTTKEAFELLRNAQAKPTACILVGVDIPYYSYYQKYRYAYKYNYGEKPKKQQGGFFIFSWRYLQPLKVLR